MALNWSRVQFDWNRARAFLVTAEEGSFSAAGRALDLAQPTVGRQVTALEEELGVLLFNRVGTGLELTPTGLDLLQHIRAMAEAATHVSLVAEGQSTSVEGEVLITASEAVAAYLLPTAVARIRAEQPGIEVEIVVANEVRDLTRREADIAVRNVRPTQAELVGRKVADGIAYFYATPEYLERVGMQSSADVANVDMFAFDRTDLMIDTLRSMGLEVDRAQFPIVTSNHLVQWQMCRQGLGLCMMMAAVGDADPGVVRVLPEVSIAVPRWLVAHRELRTSRRIRVVFDILAEELAGAHHA